MVKFDTFTECHVSFFFTINMPLNAGYFLLNKEFHMTKGDWNSWSRGKNEFKPRIEFRPYTIKNLTICWWPLSNVRDIERMLFKFVNWPYQHHLLKIWNHFYLITNNWNQKSESARIKKIKTVKISRSKPSLLNISFVQI